MIAMRRGAAVVFAALLFALLLLPAASAYSGPDLYGKVASDHTLLVFSWPGILDTGANFVQDGMVLQEDLIYASVFGPNGALNITITQYLERQVPVQVQQGNSTITVQRTERYDVTNATVHISVVPWEVTTAQVPIPTSPSAHLMEIGYLNAVWKLTHRTAPGIWPIGIVTRGGQLAFFLSTVLLTSVVWGFGTGTASLVLRRVRYWPKLDFAAWALFVFALGMATLVLLFFAWYDLAGIDWWWWMVPLFFLSTFVMVQALPSPAEAWLLERFHGTPRNDELVVSIDKIIVAPDGANGFILVHSRLVRKAILRLFGARTKVTFDEGPPAWYARNDSYDGTLSTPKRIYLLDPGSDFQPRHERFGWKPWVWKLKRPGFIDGECPIHLSTQHSRPPAAFMAGLIALTTVSKEREDLRISAQQYKAQLRAGAITEHINDLDVLATELGLTEGVEDRGMADERVDEIRKSRHPEPKGKAVIKPDVEVE